MRSLMHLSSHFVATSTQEGKWTRPELFDELRVYILRATRVNAR